jgi:hypothetical protein
MAGHGVGCPGTVKNWQIKESFNTAAKMNIV